MENEHNLLPSELHDPHGSHGQKVLKERKFVEGDRLHETQEETIRLERIGTTNSRPRGGGTTSPPTTNDRPRGGRKNRRKIW